MGLSDLSTQEFEKVKELLKLLGVFGISEDDLRYLPEAIKKVKSLDQPKQYTPSDELKKQFEDKKINATTAEDFVKSFSKDIEEIYPNERGNK